MSTPSVPTPAPRAGARKYVPAVGPRLRKLLYFILFWVALIGANSIYLASVTALEWATGRTYQDYFYQYMFLVHLVMGLVLIAPFVVFGVVHMVNTWNRRNRRAVRVGYALFAASLAVLTTGVLLVRLPFFDLKHPVARSTVYWLHVGSPLAAIWLYWLHRLAGPRIKWRLGFAYAGAVGAVVIGMVVLHLQDPRKWNVAGPKEGADKYFFPSLSRTSDGNFIPAKTLQMDHYCQKCHQDAHAAWSNSVHRFSSFNNPAYLASVRETRKFSMERDGNMRAARWCAGCHDTVPFFSGAFDNPEFDDVKDPTAQAGLTCTTCHAITHVNSNRGNADYTIEEPLHYPFAYSDNPILQYVNMQLVKAKPAFHKQTFLKPLHKTAEFCSTCHKVHLPPELNHYKFLRGQNHYDTFLLSGVSGHGARSFYYPPQAQVNCNGCHMPLQASQDFGAKLFPGAESLSIHDHLFPGANIGIAYLRDKPDIVKAHQEFLKGTMRVDIFGIREGGVIDGQLTAPLRPEVPTLKPGGKYLLETVVRTVKLGHPFTQGTADSNEIWLDVTLKSGDKVIGRSGGIDADKEVDPWSHFINVFMLDRNGNRIDRRNPQDIFVPLYNHQIPPGAGQTVHYELDLPEDLAAPVTVELKLQYRKFDKQYMDFVTQAARPGDIPIRGYVPGEKYLNDLPITTLAVDTLTFPIEGVAEQPENAKSPIDPWQRWNDYGIGLLLKGKAELRQAAEAFAEVEKLNRFDGPLNLGRVYFTEGRLDEAVAAVSRAAQFTEPAAPPWTMAWLSGLINRQQGRLAEAEQNFRSVLEDDTPERRQRGFDFSLDYEVINLLGETLFDRAKQARGEENAAVREQFLRQAVAAFEKTLKIDSENVAAHYNLQLLYTQLGDEAQADEHRKLHARYKPDDNAGDRAIHAARKKYPAANHAAAAVVIYPLRRPGAPELPTAAAAPAPSPKVTKSDD
jgi:tetratricopeptide (TPR) repeat protein